MKKKVLIVDDDADMRTYLENLMQDRGLETATVSDGDIGWEKAQTFRPDVITLDVIMERETGVKFYRRVINDPSLKTVPVIIISGVSSYKQLFGRDHATMPRPFAFLEKPIDPAELSRTVESALARDRQT
jgi:DNA-binding NtrC family response regulator